MSRLVDIDVQLLHQTELAYLVKSVDTEGESWIPKSQCELELRRGSDMGVLTLSEADAENKRLV